jgi:antitoxin VapB
MQTAKIFQNGQSQAVRLPKSFRFEGTEVTIKRVGEGILLLPLKHSSEQLLTLLDSVDEPIIIERNQPLANDARDFD